MPPGSQEWLYVKVSISHDKHMEQMDGSTHGRTQPIPGYAICNIGDALAIFSGGILRSNLHRVMYVNIYFSVTDYITQLYH